MLKIQNLKNLKPFTESLNALKLFSDDKLEIIHITLAVGEIIPLHQNNVDVVFFVLSGIGEVIVDGEKYSAKKDDCLEIKKDLNRSWQNTGTESLLVIAVKKM